MMKYTIDWTQKDIDEMEIVHQLAVSSGGGNDKALSVVVKGKVVKYRVTDKGQIVFNFDDFEKAVACYNRT